MALPEHFWSVTAQAIAPRVVHDGPLPDGPRAWQQLATTGAHRQFVYVLSDCSGAVLYVGRTWNPRSRLVTHRRKKAWWPEVATLTLLQIDDPVESDALVTHLERFAIRRLKPAHNLVGVIA